MNPVFQVAGGKRDRDYHAWFIEHDIAAIGPGGPGPWEPDNPSKYRGIGQPALSSFYRAEAGQIMVLTVGKEVKAVGIIQEKPAFQADSKLFGNWDLFHVARVFWSRPDDPLARRLIDQAPNYLGKITPRASELKDGNIHLATWARSATETLTANGHWDGRVLDESVFKDPPIRSDWEKQLPRDRRKGITKIIGRSERLWGALQERRWDPPASENEIVALLVVPFLLELGWEPEDLALEWHPPHSRSLRVDVAGFSSSRKNPGECRLLIEAKAPGQGLVYAKGQVFAYARGEAGGPGLDVPILTTDGFTWVLYENADATEASGEIFMPELRKSASEFLKNLGVIVPRL